MAGTVEGWGVEVARGLETGVAEKGAAQVGLAEATVVVGFPVVRVADWATVVDQVARVAKEVPAAEPFSRDSNARVIGECGRCPDETSVRALVGVLRVGVEEDLASRPTARRP